MFLLLLISQNHKTARTPSTQASATLELQQPELTFFTHRHEGTHRSHPQSSLFFCHIFQAKNSSNHPEAIEASNAPTTKDRDSYLRKTMATTQVQ